MSKKEKREKQRITFYVEPRHRFIHLLKGNSMILNELLDRFFGDGDTEREQTAKLLKARELIHEIKRKISVMRTGEGASTANGSARKQAKEPRPSSSASVDHSGQKPDPAQRPVEGGRSFVESANQHGGFFPED